MIRGLFGSGTIYQELRAGLDQDMTAAQGIFDRIANAANGDGNAAAQGDFQGVAESGEAEEVNLEEEVANLVSTNLRYDAETRLLREAYSRLRTAISGNG